MIVEHPANVTESAGGAAAFLVRADGSAPLSYQWLRDGITLPGETRAWLAFAPLSTGDAGTYTVRVTGPQGTVASRPATLTVTPAPPPLVDSSFVADPAIDLVPNRVLTLPDGRVLIVDGVAGRLLRLDAAGRIDATFRAPTFASERPVPAWLDGVKLIEAATLQPDDRLLVGGAFTSVGGEPRHRLARLNSDGTLDTTFTPAADAVTGGVSAIAVQSDGRILIANGGERVLRLLAGGQLDPTFSPVVLRLTDADGNIRRASVVGVALGPDGTIFAAAEYDLNFAPAGILVSRGAVLRLTAEGRVDETYARPSTQARFIGMQPLADGSLMLATRRAAFRQRVTEIRRHRADGTLDEAYPVSDVGTAQAFYPDGRLVFAAPVGPVRLTAAGAADPTFTGGIGAVLALAQTADDRLIVAGNFEVYNGTRRHRVARLNRVATEAANAPRILGLVADRTTVNFRETITVRALVNGSGALTYDWWGPWSLSDPMVGRTIAPTIAFAFTEAGENRDLTVRALNTRGEATSAPLRFTVLPDPPRIISQPTRVSAQTGRDVAFVIGRNSTSGDVEFDWRRDGQPLVSAGQIFINREALFLANVSAADAGTYTLTLRNTLGATITTAPIVLTIDDSSRFTNLSARSLVNGDGPPAIAGFVVSGNRGRTVLVRGIGPGLAKFGVTNPLPDPQVALFTSDGEPVTLANSDDWDEDANVEGLRLRPTFENLGAFPLETGSKDAAFIAILNPGATYTVHLTGKPGQSGVALLEIYEADNDAARTLNLSTRAFVAPAEPAIAGFGIRGPVSKRVLLRAVGPSLAPFGVPATLPNPRLSVRDASGIMVAANDNWGVGNDAAELRAAMIGTGAFPLVDGGRDAALLVTLAPGNYTALVEDAEGASGTALVEVYEVP